MKREEEKESWNKKRVGTALLIVFLLLILGSVFLFRRSLILGNQGKPLKKEDMSIKNIKLEDVIQREVQSLKQQAANIDIEEIASSSPQIQMLINDLKSLENYPKNQAREICLNICKGL